MRAVLLDRFILENLEINEYCETKQKSCIYESEMKKEDYLNMLVKEKSKRKTNQNKKKCRSSVGASELKSVKKDFPYFYATLIGIKNRVQQGALIDKITHKQMTTIQKLVSHFLNENIPMPDAQVKKLARHKTQLYDLAVGSKKSMKHKKKILKMKGGIVIAPMLAALAPVLLKSAISAAATGAVGGVVKGLVSKKKK